MQKFRIATLLLFSLFAKICLFAQDNPIVIKGKVVDAKSQQPAQFVNISLQGKSSGTATDESGNYELRITPKENLKVVFSHINYQKKVVPFSVLRKDKKGIIMLEPKQEILENVIVSASLYEQPKNVIAKSAAIINHKEIKGNFNSNIIDVLSSTPGFTQVWEYHSPIILRGLNSKRLILMKNGNRRVGTFPGGYFGQDMNVYDVKKIEIIKGPGSVIYGSGAISGIVNIIGHEPFGKEETKANILSGYGSNNNEFLEVANVCYKKENFGIQLNGKYRKTGNFVYGNGETADNSNVEDRDFSLSTGVRLSPKQSIKVNADYHYGDWGKPRGFNGPSKRFTKIRNEENNIHAGLDYTFKPQGFIEQISVNLYYDNGNRDYYKYKYSEVTGDLSSLELVKYKDIYGGGRIFMAMNLSDISKLTVGMDAYAFDIDNPAETLEPFQGPLPASSYYGAGQQSAGAFVRNETQLGEKIKLVSGLRYDYAKVISGERTIDTTGIKEESRTAFSGNLGMVFSLDKQTHISANFGRAFRMPTAEEMFTEVISCKGIKKGNPELTPEYSWNLDLGIRGNSLNNKLKYDLSLFYNTLDDFIYETQALDDEDVDFTFKNTDAVIYGGELLASYRFDNVIKAGNVLFTGLGSSYVYGIDKYVSDDEPLFGIPPLKINLDLNYRGLANNYWLTGYSVKIQTEYAAAQNRVAAVPEGTDPGPWGYEPSDPHTVFNLAIGLNSNALPGHPKLRFIVKNILGTNYQAFGSYIPAMGRNFKTTLSFTIN